MGNVCWSSDLSEKGIEASVDYTELFQKGWSIEDLDWSNRNKEDKWQKECLGEDNVNQWSIMPKFDNGAQYLGLCEKADMSQIKFVKRIKEGIFAENQDLWSFYICGQDCWVSDQAIFGTSAQVLETEQAGNWKKVNFYKN